MSVARVQHPAPQFKTIAVVDGDIKEDVSLKDYAGKWVVLVFFPLAWTFVCPTEVVAFSDSVQAFRDRGAEVLFCSVDSEYSLLSWANAPRRDGGLGSVNFPLLSDKTHSIARDYGVLLEDQGVALRGLFIIDPTQKLRQITVNDLPVGRSVDETLRLLDAFKFTDEFGEVCPANWQQGQSTMKANPTESKAYFQKVNA